MGYLKLEKLFYNILKSHQLLLFLYLLKSEINSETNIGQGKEILPHQFKVLASSHETFTIGSPEIVSFF